MRLAVAAFALEQLNIVGSRFFVSHMRWYRMNCFQLVKTVLDELYQEIDILDVDDKDAAISTPLRQLADEYGNLLVGANIDYSDPVTRFAYVYKYVTAHADLVCQLLERSDTLRNLFDRDRVTVTSLGGGPGTELLGILKFMECQGKSSSLHLEICDREEFWGEAWTDVSNKIKAPCSISTSFRALDVTKSVSLGYKKLLAADLFTMVYFMSEVYATREQAQQFFDNLFTKAKPGALFIFADNNSNEFTGWFDSLVEIHGVEVLENGSANFQVRFDEEKSALGSYLEKFDHQPRLRANMAYRICRKR